MSARTKDMTRGNPTRLILSFCLPIIAGNLLNISLQFGGTSLLIVVGVALETVKALEQQLIVRNYKGFLK